MTIASPAHPEPLSGAAGDLLRASLADTSQFWLRFSEVATFSHGTVFIAPDHSEDLNRLFRNLANGFGEFGGVRADHVWHLSVARRGGPPLADTFRATFEPISVLVKDVAIWTQDHPGAAWSIRHRSGLLTPAR